MTIGLSWEGPVLWHFLVFPGAADKYIFNITNSFILMN